MDNEQSNENTGKADTASAVDPHQGGANNHTGLDPIQDIQVKMTLEIGSTSLPIRDLLKLSQGSLVTLDSLVGQPHDVLVNGTLIAKGEVVVTDEKFAIRFTEIVSPSERIKSLT